MKAAAFSYARAETVADACARLGEHGPDAKLIAGGQSLVPMMAMRLARPAWLIDIARIPELQSIVSDEDAVTIGAAVRQCVLETDAVVGARVPLLARALRWVGHAQTRNRGTLGGSIVHADPSAELPLVACTLDAVLELQASDGIEAVPAREFFFAPMVTAIRPEQCLARVRLPVWTGARVGCAFEEVAIRHGDFALASACAQIEIDTEGRCLRAVLGIGGAAGVPLALPHVAETLIGTKLEDRALAEAAAAAAGELDPEADLHATAAYRRHLAQVLAERALRAAREDAVRQPGKPS